MTDVFVSYASEDRERVRKLANTLEAHGWSVWWDRKIIAGQTFDQVIEHELETAKSVVVLWSNHSITSEWVKNEAAVASERGVLIPALIDRVKPPLEFRRKQTADLVEWDGDPLQEGFRALCDGVAAIGSGTMPHHSTGSPPLMFSWNRRWTLGVIAALAIVLGFVGYKVLIISPMPKGNKLLIEKRDKGSQPFKIEISSDGRFEKLKNGVVHDKKTKLDWYVGPDKSTTWRETQEWIKDLFIDESGWLVPTMEELTSLLQKNKKPRHMTSLLKTTGWRIWASGPGKSLEENFPQPLKVSKGFKYYFDFSIGSESQEWTDPHYDKADLPIYRAFAVRPHKN